MGDVEVRDQSFVVRHLISRKIVDSSRVGIMGWSYGGYMSLMCLFKENDLFCCAVSGAPVTSWVRTVRVRVRVRVTYVSTSTLTLKIVLYTSSYYISLHYTIYT